ncbi:hypothetical protein A2311_01080 [candidate division WOR-1 bacterium RIFOXYB2_FULL_48_7]|uniref:Uncharacterized protein n=1 Tax=candidate division WOR-1 bacterium RIFOXYB2_FULL_48_7 TaxID=1802583 RepID=A0A1F4TNM5_UNCSA|nr:MAG: hypothetical protein A2311_01080 [candidate division WOR-1 bacterium RIFOXYB2_FULL_48_7]
MSTISDGMHNVNAITSQINALQEQAPTTESASIDPEEALVRLQSNFNDMLTKLISSDDDDDDDDSADPFAFLSNTNNNLTSGDINADAIAKYYQQTNTVPLGYTINYGKIL